MELFVIDGERKSCAFSSSVISWRFRISTGPRCQGLNSTKTYKSRELAYKAGVRMIKKFDPTFTE